MVDERMGAIDAYSELLNDPDPDRALAAMQIMIGIDDPQISRMALMNGLTSTTPAVRRAALKGYFDSQPNLEVFLDGTGFDPAQFTQKVSNASGTVDGDGNGYLTYRVGAYDDGMGCYVYHAWTNQCLVKLSESTVTIMLWKRAAPFGLDETGTLKGDVLVGSLTPAAKTSIPVRP